jgi:hypothetical protein
MAEVAEFLDEWHRVVAMRDTDGLHALIAEGARIGAPPYWQKLEGRDIVEHLLGIILSTIEDFTYHREWVRDDELALEFQGRVGELDLQGIDLISLDSNGRLVEIDVMIRPLNAVTELMKRVKPQMTAFFASQAAQD